MGPIAALAMGVPIAMEGASLAFDAFNFFGPGETVSAGGEETTGKIPEEVKEKLAEHARLQEQQRHQMMIISVVVVVMIMFFFMALLLKR